MKESDKFTLNFGDALILVDVQKDFLPGGSLAIDQAEKIVPVLNTYLSLFSRATLPIFMTRDWHPANHCSFIPQGGPWPPHCVADTPGAEFADDLELPGHVNVISKARDTDKEAYSGFQDTDLNPELHSLGVKRLFVGGLTTDFCVLNTVQDALTHGYRVCLLKDAIRAVDQVEGHKAINTMRRAGVVTITVQTIQ